MDRFDEMNVFLRVAETGSFTRAAEVLRLPRASVSLAVQQLEARLGTRLFHRTTRRVQLTQDGQAMLERCRTLLSDLDEVEGLFQRDRSQVAGKLKVDVSSRMGRMVIAPALPEFFRRYPNIELELGMTDRLIDLVQEGVDCAIRGALTMEDSSLVSRRIAEFPVVNCASLGYVAQYGMPQSIEDLAQHWVVNYASPTTGRLYPWEYLEDGAIKTVQMQSRITVNNAEAYMACCQAGLGMIQVPAQDLGGLLAAEGLVEVLPAWRPAPMQLCALYPHRRHLSRRVQAFIEWVEELLSRPTAM
ncbi:MAG: LysR family transcriptional regulator [Burkholderiaceae bacterium]|nr:LysR family transcriptional regulator [Burkholderiaceae bacterium]